MVSTNSKNQKIQILRAIAICAVVIIHSYQKNLFGVYIRAFVNFAVSMFFFLSGYLTKLENDNWKQFWIKRIKRVVIPYIIWSVLWTVGTRNFDHFFTNLLTGKCVFPYYFVFVYVQFVLFTPLISKLIRSKYNWIGWLFQPIAIFLLRYLGLETYVPFSILFSWFGPYYLGMMLGNRVFQWNFSYKKTTFLWIVSLAISIAEGLVWFKAGNYDLATTQLKLSNCLYSAMCILLAYKYINDKDIDVKDAISSKIMITLGDYSFGIFLAHAFVLMIMKQLPIYKYLVFPINSALIIIITALCVWCGRKILGEKYGKYLGLY